MKTILFIIFLFSVGCATKYQPDGFSGGYYDRKVGPNKWLVGFNGNGYTARSTVQDYAFKRAEELCHEQGFREWELSSTSDVQQPSAKPAIEIIVSCK